MSRSFAQLETSLPHSKKLRQLTHPQRWAYLCAHLSPMCGYLGLFRYPVAVWADDADMTRTDIESAIEAMLEVGLIEYDHGEEVCRINNWFLKKNAPENASRMASLATDYIGATFPDELLTASAAEFVVGCIKRAQRWKKDSPEWPKLRGVFHPFLDALRSEFEDDFHEALADQLEGHNRAVRAELSALMPSLAYYLEAPCQQGGGTVGAHDTETTRDQENTNTKKHPHGAISDGFALPQSFPSDRNPLCAEKALPSIRPRPETIALAKRMDEN